MLRVASSRAQELHHNAVSHFLFVNSITYKPSLLNEEDKSNTLAGLLN